MLYGSFQELKTLGAFPTQEKRKKIIAYGISLVYCSERGELAIKEYHRPKPQTEHHIDTQANRINAIARKCSICHHIIKTVKE